MLTRILIQTACRLFFVLIGASVAYAGSFSVHPIRMTLSDSQKIGTITLRNKGTEPIILQMEILSWSQRESKDVFTATREILANPPILTIPVGGSQLIRIGLRRASFGAIFCQSPRMADFRHRDCACDVGNRLQSARVSLALVLSAYLAFQ